MFTHPGEQEEYEKGAQARLELIQKAEPQQNADQKFPTTFVALYYGIPLLILLGLLILAARLS